MGTKTHVSNYDKYVAKCKKLGTKPKDFIDFIIEQES